MTDLAEFLLARIAEDEAEARKRLHHAQQNDLMVRDPKHLGKFMPGWWEWREIEAFARRAVADAEAKRRIVMEYVSERNTDHYGEMRDIGYEEGLEQAVSLLALPYADHPDYQPEWRTT